MDHPGTHAANVDYVGLFRSVVRCGFDLPKNRLCGRQRLTISAFVDSCRGLASKVTVQRSLEDLRRVAFKDRLHLWNTDRPGHRRGLFCGLDSVGTSG